MPNVGEIRKGKEIGLPGGIYIWSTCADCNKERWVIFIKGLPAYSLCNRCATKEYVRTHQGKNHPNWGGGRYIEEEGYVQIRLSKDDPFYSMVNSSGTVYEHRYVMAQHLGRPLAKDEIVHHLPEAKSKGDNRIEVLELHSTQSHGREWYEELTRLRQKVLDLELENIQLRKSVIDKPKEVSNA